MFFVTKTATAKPLDPIPEPPKWATSECLAAIGRIVEHEVGHMDKTAWRFLATQVIYDVRRLGCKNLTQWRWAIGAHSFKVKRDIAEVVMDVVLDYPKMAYPRCQFVGMPADVPVWKAAGYSVSEDYRNRVGNLVLVGVNCK